MDLNALRIPSKPAIVFDDRTLSWSELAQLVNETAGDIYKRVGTLDKQIVIGLLLPNGWQFVVSYLAILKLGHIAMPLDPTFKEIEVRAVLDQIPAEMIITDNHYSKLLGSGNDGVKLFDDIKHGSGHDTDFVPFRIVASKQIASLVFTSGTTGRPKAAPYTHRNHIWNIEACSSVWNWNQDDSLLISLSLAHWYGLVMGLSGIIYHGNTMYLQDWFDEKKTLQALASGKITIFTHISTVYLKLIEERGDYDISGVRLCISGGSALPPAVWETFKQRFGQEILECYGSSETGRIASNLLDERIPGSPGRILDGVDLKLSSESEVLIKSDGVFPGYYKNAKATKSSHTSDGYWRTGDIADMQNGRIVLKGRVQERIRRFGYTISPRDIEWALHQNPKIKETYVLGAQAPDQPNDTLIYFIKSELSVSEIDTYCKENLPFAWRADSIIKLDSIPRTRNGKPKIDKLRQLAEGARHA
ncbi:acyl--CoA ligase [Candidatus Saccharibacteria bacterium]|nr:acyl--CoA ligase [Candidatus Saccharibacteria bacterium]